MSEQQYEYFGLMAQTWDLLRGDTSKWPDRFFYLDIIQQYGEPVLDVGCGTGRLLLDYMQKGISIDGVDNSPEMLGICRQKADALNLDPRLYHQEMQSLDLPRTYRTILVPSSSFQLLVTPDYASQAMRRFYDLLKPGGVLVMPFMILVPDNVEGDTYQEDWHVIQEAERPQDGATIRRWSRIRYDLVEKLEHTEDRYEVVVDGEIIDSEYHAWSPATRWYSQTEALKLFELAGFVNLKVLSKFTWEKARSEDKLFTILGEHPISSGSRIG